MCVAAVCLCVVFFFKWHPLSGELIEILISLERISNIILFIVYESGAVEHTKTLFCHFLRTLYPTNRIIKCDVAVSCHPACVRTQHNHMYSFFGLATHGIYIYIQHPPIFGMVYIEGNTIFHNCSRCVRLSLRGVSVLQI